MVRIKFEGRNLEDLDFFTKSDPFLILSRPARNGAGFVKVRKTETIWNNLNPSWKVLYIPTPELCDNNFQMPLNIEVFDEDRNSHNDLIGSVQLTLSDLQSLSNSHSPVILRKGPKNRGQLLVTECQIEEPATDLERRGSISSYPARRESVFSTSEGFQQPLNTQQAATQELLCQGQERFPAYHPPDHNNPPFGPTATQNVSNSSFSQGEATFQSSLFPPPPTGGYAQPPLTGGYAQPPLTGGYDQPPFSGGYSQPPCSGGYAQPPTFLPTIPDDITDTRPQSIWL